MDTIVTQDMATRLRDSIGDVVRQEADELIADIEDEAIKKLKGKIREVVSGVVLRVLDRVTFDNMGHEILIHVKIED